MSGATLVAKAGLRLLQERLVGVLEDRLRMRSVDEAGQVGRGNRTACGPCDHAQDVTGVAVAAAGTEMLKLRYTAALPTRGQSP